MTDNESTTVGTLLTGNGSFMSPTSSVDSMSDISSGSFLSLITSDVSFAFAVSGNGLLSPIAGCIGSASAISGGDSLFSIASSVDFASAVSSDSFYSLVADDSSLFLTTCDPFLSAIS